MVGRSVAQATGALVVSQSALSPAWAGTLRFADVLRARCFTSVDTARWAEPNREPPLIAKSRAARHGLPWTISLRLHRLGAERVPREGHQEGHQE